MRGWESGFLRRGRGRCSLFSSSLRPPRTAGLRPRRCLLRKRPARLCPAGETRHAPPRGAAPAPRIGLLSALAREDPGAPLLVHEMDGEVVAVQIVLPDCLGERRNGLATYDRRWRVLHGNPLVRVLFQQLVLAISHHSDGAFKGASVRYDLCDVKMVGDWYLFYCHVSLLGMGWSSQGAPRRPGHWCPPPVTICASTLATRSSSVWTISDRVHPPVHGQQDRGKQPAQSDYRYQLRCHHATIARFASRHQSPPIHGSPVLSIYP